VAVKYKSTVMFRYGGNEANAKSVLSVLGAGIRSGTQLEFVCEGEDEQEALAAIVAVVEDGLGE
jgi:phosphocarrier protein